jgi:glucosyl-dolichyl phosphate glucuronosyltransferase
VGLNDTAAIETRADFSVLISAFTLERWDSLVAAVESVRGQTLAAREIIVVIDGNEELQRRAQAYLEGAIVTANAHGPGLCGGRQTGAEMARGSLLAYLDDDTIADPDWLEQHAAAYRDPAVLGVGGPVVPMWRGLPPRWLPEEFFWVIGCTYAGLPQDAGRIRNPIGSNMSMRAEVLARTGGFEARLSRTRRGRSVSGSCDETEFCIRASQRHPDGYWVFQPRARVHHQVPVNRTTWRYFVHRCRLEGASKAIVTGLIGPVDGLQSERTYTRSVLPRAVARELASALHGEGTGVLRAATIIAGLLITGTAYAEGRARLRWRPE